MLRTNSHLITRTTIALRKQTKTKLDKNRAPGQCYDGFISQLMDQWQEMYRRKGAGQKTAKA